MNALAAAETVRTIPGEAVDRARHDLGIKDASGFATETLGKIRRNLSADLVVSGAYWISQTDIHLDYCLQNAATGDTIGRGSADAPQLSDAIERTAAQLRRKLGIAAPSDAEEKSIKAALPSGTESSRLYARGINELRAYNLLAARDDLEGSIKSDPNYALARQALARTWQELGYDDKAIQEMKRAMDLSSNLPPTRHRDIEGTYWRMIAEWNKAIDRYRSLHDIYPDELDYGLELASVQTLSGRGQDALATLDSLRNGSNPASEDPRIDLQEALAAGSVSKLDLKRTVAERAAQKAVNNGSNLLAAEAYWQECSALHALGEDKQAESVCQNANQLSDSAGGEKVKARSLTLLATIQVSEGKTREAIVNRQAALRIATQIGSRKDIIGALMNLASLEGRKVS